MSTLVNDISLTDEEMVELIQKGNNKYMAKLYVRYQSLFYYTSLKYMSKNHISQNLKDDFVDIAVESFHAAIKSFDTKKNTHFLNYWWSIKDHNFSSYLFRIKRKKIYYFDPKLVEEKLSDFIDDDLQSNVPHTIYDAIEIDLSELGDLTDREILLFKCLLVGHENLDELVELLGWSKSKAYRTKRKLLEQLQKNKT